MNYAPTLAGIGVGFVGDLASDAIPFEAVNGLLRLKTIVSRQRTRSSPRDFDFESFRSENLRGGWQTRRLPERAARNESRSQRIAPGRRRESLACRAFKMTPCPIGCSVFPGFRPTDGSEFIFFVDAIFRDPYMFLERATHARTECARQLDVQSVCSEAHLQPR